MGNHSKLDIQLLARSLEGDADAFGDLYERYLDPIYHYIIYRVGGRSEAQDLTEAVFLRAWQALKKNPPREIPFRLWLYRIANNIVIDFYRARKQNVTLESVGELQMQEEGPEALLMRQERSEALVKALQTLKEEHQQVIVCRFVVGMSHSETAVIMQKNEVALRALQYRAIAALKKKLLVKGDFHV